MTIITVVLTMFACVRLTMLAMHVIWHEDLTLSRADNSTILLPTPKLPFHFLSSFLIAAVTPEPRRLCSPSVLW